ncbi:WD40 repeat domain-containing protein [Nonomuraea turkmeniaca]|uniref:WD40 repeat domain-containing protein n=1 Tax=Nonomuraea turkmeniaca TaxID=103838 RepID=A0A5S4FNY6_9ACTN|nr:WD40 repeat domain-containing protein [Nonomuraea turkmeniaca]
MRPLPPELARAGTSLITRLIALSSALAIAAGLTVAVAPAVSAADSMTYLDGMTKARDVAAGGGQVFVSGDDQIIVTDSRGTITDTITDLPGASGLAMTPDSTRMFVALSGAQQVIELDTDSLTVIRRIDVAPHPCPSNLALSGDRLWVGYGCGNTFNGGVFGLDLSAAAPEPAPVVGNIYNAPLVDAAGGTLVVGETGLSACDLMVYDVSGTTAVQRGIVNGFEHSLVMYDLAITSDGSMVILNNLDGWDTTSLTKTLSFEGGAGSVAISPDGAHLAATGTTGNDITTYDMGTTTRTYRVFASYASPVIGTLAFSGTDVFTVLEETTSQRRLRLWRAEGAALPGSTLKLTAPSTGTALVPVTATGTLTLPDGSAPGPQPLVVARKLPDGTSTTIPGVTTSADGAFTFTDAPPISGAVTYEVLWDGNADFRWSRTSATVTVARHPSTITLSGPTTGVVGKQLSFSGGLDAGDQTPPSGALLVVYRAVSGGNLQLVGTVNTNSDGSFGFVDTPTVGGEHMYEVRWDGTNVFMYTRGTHNVTVRGRP